MKEMYATVNQMFGDIVKVTPSSKVVGDTALFMVQNNLTEQDIYERGDRIDFPGSVIRFFRSLPGQPPDGFPKRLQEVILKEKNHFTTRPGEMLEPIDLSKVKKEPKDKIGREPSELDIMYPQVFLQWSKTAKNTGICPYLKLPSSSTD